MKPTFKKKLSDPFSLIPSNPSMHLTQSKKLVLLFNIRRGSFEIHYFEVFDLVVNGMLRHFLATLEGSNILWHIVAPSPPPRPLFVSLS